MSDSQQEEHEDDNNNGENRQERFHSMKGKQCPHKANIKSSGNLDIKDLLTSCDECIHDLLTPSQWCGKDLLTPTDGCIKELLKRTDSSVKDLITPDDSGVNNLNTPDDFIGKELITSDDRSLKVLLEVEERSVKDLITPDDCNINVKDLTSPDDCSIKALLTAEGHSVKDHITPHDCSVKDLITPDDCNVNVKDLISPDDFSVKALLTTEECSAKDLIRRHDCNVKDLITPHDSSVKDLITPDDCSVKDLITPDDFSASTPLGGKSSVTVEDISRPFCKDEHGKEKEHRIPSSLGHRSPLESKTDLIPEQTPPFSELLLLKSGDVELNPGPREGPGWGLELERELLSLVKDVPSTHFYDLCNALDCTHAQSQAVLSKHHWDFPASLLEIMCSWGLKQRDGTNYKEVLADKLRSVHLDALGTKLLEGRYLPPENSPSASASDGGKHTGQLTPEQVNQCAQDFQTFYRTYMCKIKTDPLDFNSIFEFEKIYTNLVLLRNEAGKQFRTPLEYKNLLRTKVNNELSKRLMVEGEGGAGKTTFCSKIAWDWCNGCQEFQQFEWVLLIHMRDIQDGQTIGEIVKRYLSDSNTVRPEEIDKYILAQPSKVFIIFDGLDEYSGGIIKHGSDIAKILRSEKFKECTVLVTTRPWKADQIKSNQEISKPYSFIGVQGFSSKNISSYIMKYFADDENAGDELIKFIEDNDVIKENMATFPIYVAMLCILWRDSTSERRDMIRKLKTFSQLFEQMIMFLKDHCVSKLHKCLDKKLVSSELDKLDNFLIDIGAIAFTGLLKKQLTFDEDSFSSCHEAMEACCKIGVLSREDRVSSRWERSRNTTQPLTSCVFFPHKLFQEYVSALYLASLYNLNREEYGNAMRNILQDSPWEFEYLMYFTASQANDVGLDIISQVMGKLSYNDMDMDMDDEHFIVDVTFEAHDATVGKTVGQQIFPGGKALIIGENMSAHTLSGYLFIMEKCALNTLDIRGSSYGPTVSHDLADILSSPSALKTLKFLKTSFHDDFYLLLKHVSTVKKEKSINSVQELHVDHVFINDLKRFDISIETLFPNLKQLHLNALQTISPGIMKHLAHSSLSMFEIALPDADEYEEFESIDEDECYPVLCPVPLIGETDSLKQLFSISFPHLTNLIFENVVIGNIRCEAIIRSLRNHTHIKVIRVIKCFTDDELDSLASEISKEKSIEIILQHDPVQNQLHLSDGNDGALSPELMDALCHRTCVRELHVHNIFKRTSNEALILDRNGREVDSKIHRIRVTVITPDEPLSCLLGRFISLLPGLTHLILSAFSLRDEFYKEITDRASFSKIEAMVINGKWSGTQLLYGDAAEQKPLAKLLCSLQCLKDFTIDRYPLHDDFFTELTSSPASSQIKKVFMRSNADISLQVSAPASKQLAKFLCSLPCLKNLTIRGYHLHDDFFTELTSSPASSQIKKMDMWSNVRESLQVSALASKQLAKFLCSLPCLRNLTIRGYHLHDDFFTELTSSPASSQIQTIDIQGCNFGQVSGLASKQLAKFLCTLPCLKDLTIEGYHLHDDFYFELSSSPAIPQKSSSREMLQEWSAKRRRQQLPLSHTHEHEHRPLSPERIALFLPYLHQSAQSSSEYPSDHQRSVRSESSQFHQFTMPAHPHERESLERQGLNILQQPAQPSTGQQNNDRRNIQSDLQQVNPTQQHPTGHSAGMNPMYEYDDDPDRPSTSGLSSAYARAGATPAYDHRTPLGRKRIYSDTDSDDDSDDNDDDDEDDDNDDAANDDAGAAVAADRVSIVEGREHRPRKRLAKTDQKAPSP